MTILIVSRRRLTACATKSHLNENNYNDTILLCRTPKEALRITRYQKIDVIMMDDGDLIDIQKLADFDGEIRYFTSVRDKGDIATRLGRCNYYVSKLLAIVREYWDSYGFKQAWIFPGHFAIRLLLEAINAIKPIVIVDTMSHRIGHQAYNNHIFMLKQARKPNPPAVIAITPDPANIQLMKMQGRYWCSAVKNKVLVKMLRNPVIVNSAVWDSAHWYRDIDEPLHKHDGGEVFLAFTDKERVSGLFLRKEMSITDRPWHVCFHSRDPEYLAQAHDYMSREGWQYHDFRDCHIGRYLPAAQWLAQQGGYAIRMGAVVAEPLPDTSDYGVIDYATKHRSDFGDIYLTATARFFLGAGCGLTQVATVFGVPVAVANYPILEWTTNLRKGDLYIPKLMWWDKAARFLHFNEWMQSGVGRMQRSEDFQQAGVTPRENTSDEVLELCQEMYAKLEGTWVEQDGDIALMEAYNDIMKQPQYRCAGVEAEIATTFLRRHAVLLERLVAE